MYPASWKEPSCRVGRKMVTASKTEPLHEAYLTLTSSIPPLCGTMSQAAAVNMQN